MSEDIIILVNILNFLYHVETYCYDHMPMPKVSKLVHARAISKREDYGLYFTKMKTNYKTIKKKDKNKDLQNTEPVGSIHSYTLAYIIEVDVEQMSQRSSEWSKTSEKVLFETTLTI